MVKNTGGGNKGKKGCTGNISIRANNAGVRQAREEGEIYAIVTKIYGHAVMSDALMEKIVLLDNCSEIRSIRNARDNRISANSWVLVGLRSWEIKRSMQKKRAIFLRYIIQVMLIT